MGRIYTVPIDAIAVTTLCDIVSITCGSFALQVVDFRMGQSNIGKDAGEDEWSLRFAKLGGAATVGSKGNAVTPRPDMADNTAASFTARANDTFPSTNASGSYYICEGDAWNVRGPFRPTWLPGCNPKIRPGESWVVQLSKGPVASTNVSGTLFVQEGP